MTAQEPIPRPLPRPNIYLETKAFWEGAKEHKLLLQYDAEVRRYQWPPRPVSIYTGRRKLEWREASGRGKLYTWTLSLVAWPGHADRAPYMCALIDLEEGVRILANLINYDEADLVDGAPVRLVWEKLNDDFEYYQFEPVRP